MEQRICGYRECGKPLTGQQRRWCCEAHRVAEWRRIAEGDEPKHFCKTCGEEIPLRAGSGRRRVYCGNACRPSRSRPRSPVHNRRCGHELCGASFTTSQPRQRYCSLRCRDEASRYRNSVEVDCAVCGLTFRKRREDIERWAVHCCSNECKAFAKRSQTSCSLVWVTCRTCQETWLAGRGRPVKCEQCHLSAVAPSGPVCRLPRSPRAPRRFVSSQCEHCAEFFLDRDGYHPETYRFCPACKPKRWKKDKQRAERYGVAYEPIDRRKVYRRDDYRCGICGEQTDPDAALNSPRAPTLDHIVPISQGGPHLYSNVQCACFECNWRKADGTDAAPKYPKDSQGVGGRGSLPRPDHFDTVAPLGFSPRALEVAR